MSQDERRRRSRIRVNLRVQFQPGKDRASFESTTHDISSDGFYCLTPTAFNPGDALACQITCPSHAPDNLNKPFVIKCDIRVVRCRQDTSTGLFGTACRIEEYSCSHLSAVARAETSD